MYLKLLVLSVLFCFISRRASAQIEGGVKDEKENPVPYVTLTAMDSTGKIVETVISGQRGFYAFSNLNKGKYKIEAKTAGYHAILENIIVTRESVPANQRKKDISSSTRLDIILVHDK